MVDWHSVFLNMSDDRNMERAKAWTTAIKADMELKGELPHTIRKLNVWEAMVVAEIKSTATVLAEQDNVDGYRARLEHLLTALTQYRKAYPLIG